MGLPLYRVDDPWQISTLLSKQRHLARAVSVLQWACLVDAWGVAPYILWVLFRNTGCCLLYGLGVHCFLMVLSWLDWLCV